MASNLSQKNPNDRLLSLDTLRGFDMFWITGGGALFAYLGEFSGQQWLTNQMYHAEWVGFNWFDFIFPLFMFISGAVIPITLTSKLNNGVSKGSLHKKAFFRMLTLVFIGIVYNGAFSGGIDSMRFASVLGQIGIAYYLAFLIFLYSKEKKMSIPIWIGGILIAVAILQLLIPVPGIGAGKLTPDGTINGYIDRLILPGVLYSGTFDPEGILSILSATSITLMGVIAGIVLKQSGFSEYKKVYLLALTGLCLTCVALLLNPYYPIIRRCWTSSFIMIAGGVCFLMLSLFYLIIDVKKWRKWTFYFRVIGVNSIFVYLLVEFVNIRSIAEKIFGFTLLISNTMGQLILLVTYLAIVWGILYYMYKKGIFLRI